MSRYLLSRTVNPITRWLCVLTILIGTLQLSSGLSPARAEHADEPLISTIFIDTYIVDALRDIAYQAGVNIIPDPLVTGFVTVELNEVPLEQALEMVLYPGGYIFRKIDDSYLVGAADPASPMFHRLSVSDVIQLNYISADEAKRLVSDFYLKFARFDSSTNKVFITSSPTIVQRFREDIALVDRPPAQVTIEVLITELSTDARNALGLSLSLSKGIDSSSISLNPNEGLVELVWRSPSDLLRAKIVALAEEGKAEIKANPSLTVIDGKTASIFIGKDRYYKLESISSSSSTTRLESIKTGVGLKIAPRVATDGTVTLLVEPEVSDVSGLVLGEGLPLITRRQTSTTVRVKDGETIGLGGLVLQSEQTGKNGYPILSDLPIIRNFIGNSYRNTEETEVVIFLTPHIEQ